jgi:hypothetical protein
MSTIGQNMKYTPKDFLAQRPRQLLDHGEGMEHLHAEI